MDTAQVIDVLLHGNQLKRTARTGWVQRGVADAENVAAHTFGAAYTAMVLWELIDEQLDLGRVLAMVTLHDLPEGLTTDIPKPAWRYLPEGAKQTAEAKAMDTILGGADFASRWLEWWSELGSNTSPEAKLAHDADKLDQYLQARIYEQQTGNRALREFWTTPYRFHFPEAQAIYDELRRRRGYN
ncbi:MAG: HD family hydrolase [Chloroflexota bacterium]